MINSQEKTQTTTCFSSILRRLLCTGGLPTHPSSDTDNPKTDSSSTKLQSPSPTRSTTPAGIVARLMGLESFPNSSPRTTIMRKSRSVGSVDFLPNFHIPKQPHHLRARSSVSFRELPTFLQTSHNLSKVDPVRKPEMALTPIQEKSHNLNNNKKKKKVQSQKQSLKVIKSEEAVKCRKNKVIDDGFPEEQKKKKKCKSRNRTYNHPLPKMGKHDRRKVKKKTMLTRRENHDYTEDYCIKVLMEVYRLTKEEMDTSVWMGDNVQDISYGIGQEILQVLLYEMIDELCM